MSTAANAADHKWDGWYVGAQAGISTFAFGPINNDDSFAYGVHLGYNRDLGNIVIGVEIDYETEEYTVLGVTSDINTARLNFRAGYDFGQFLVYGLVGAINAKTSDTVPPGASISDNGYSFGVGLDFMATKNLIIGARYLTDDYDITGGGSPADVDSRRGMLRVSYKF